MENIKLYKEFEFYLKRYIVILYDRRKFFWRDNRRSVEWIIESILNTIAQRYVTLSTKVAI